MSSVEPIRELEQIKKVKKILSKQSERNYVLFLLGINSGLRISDILKIRVRDVRDKDFIELFEQKTGKYKRFPIKNIQNILSEYICGTKGDSYLFPNFASHKSLTRVQAYRIIKKACKKAGIKTRIGTHTLRKTFGYHFYKATKDIGLLQNILNHSSPQITLKYIGINQDIIDSSLLSFKL